MSLTFDIISFFIYILYLSNRCCVCPSANLHFCIIPPTYAWICIIYILFPLPWCQELYYLIVSVLILKLLLRKSWYLKVLKPMKTKVFQSCFEAIVSFTQTSTLFVKMLANSYKSVFMFIFPVVTGLVRVGLLLVQSDVTYFPFKKQSLTINFWHILHQCRVVCFCCYWVVMDCTHL